MATSASAQPRAGTWLYGPAPDLLLGGGIAYLLSVPLLVAVGSWTQVETWPLGFLVVFAMLVSGPHYGATLMRVYEQREDRRKYAFFAVYVTIFIGLVFVLAIRNAFVGSMLFTIYVSWAPWHFAGQNYGISLIFLRRRGVPISDRTKRFLYASFVLSFALAFVSLHAAESGVTYNATRSASTEHYAFLRLGIPHDWVRVLIPVLGLLYASAVLGAFLGLRRGATLRELAPAACPIVLQGIWYALPAFFMQSTTGNPTVGLAFAAAWIATAHSAQYLWVTSYYARRADPATRIGGYLIKATLAGAIVGILPGLLFAPGLLGVVPWDAGLAILVFSVVNIHHFILDGAIWKLRDGRIARALLRTEDDERSAEPIEPRRSRLRPLIWAVGLICFAVPFVDYLERTIAIESAGTDMARAQRVAQRLRWIGRQSADLHNHVGMNLAAQGKHEEAAREFRRSLAVFPNAAARIGIGDLQRRSGRWRDAADAYDAALALDPDAVAALVGSAAVELELAHSTGEGNGMAEPIRKLERARALSPTDVPAAWFLAHAYVREGRAIDARKVLVAALPHANARQRQALETELARLPGPR